MPNLARFAAFAPRRPASVTPVTCAGQERVTADQTENVSRKQIVAQPVTLVTAVTSTNDSFGQIAPECSDAIKAENTAEGEREAVSIASTSNPEVTQVTEVTGPLSGCGDEGFSRLAAVTYAPGAQVTEVTSRYDRGELFAYFDRRAGVREDGGQDRAEAEAAAVQDVVEAIREGRIRPLGEVPAEFAAPARKPEPSDPYRPGIVGEWQRALAGLDRHRDPCPGLRRWPEMYRTAERFLDEFGEAAARLGWTTLDLWAVHPIAGAIRLDCCGGLMVPGGAAATEVTYDAIQFGRLTHRRRPWPPGVTVVPVWNFEPGHLVGDRP